MNPIIGGLRFFQILFSIVVLGLSVTLAKGQGHGPVPATTGYAAFAGAFGIIAGLVGIAALFVDLLNGIIGWAVDGLAAVVLLAGGLAYAIGLRGVNCDNPRSTGINELLNCGSTGKIGTPDYTVYCTYGSDDDLRRILKQRCTEARADDVFLFLGFAVSLAALVASFVLGRKKMGGTYVV